jgi:Tol biopolymer transport system component
MDRSIRMLRGLAWFAVVFAPLAARADEKKTRLEARESGAFEIVAGMDEASIVVSPDAARVAYVVREGEEAAVVVVDGRPGTKYRAVAPIAFSPDGKRYAYKATRTDRKWTFVVDGKEGPLHDGARAVVHVFSPDGSRTAYVANPPTPSGATSPLYALVVDGVVGKPYQQIEERPWFSPDGKRLAFVAGTGKGPAFRMFVVVDGVDGSPYARIGSRMYDGLGAFGWSPDGKRWGHSAMKPEGGEVVVIDGVEGKVYEGVTGPVFSPDGKRWAHPAKRGAKWITVVDGKESEKEYDEIGGLAFSPTGVPVYAARRDKAWFVVLDGVEGKEHGRVGTYSIRFSPDGKRVAYWATAGTKPPPITFVLDGVEQGDFTNIGANRNFGWSSFSFGPDGKRTAFAAEKGGKWVVVTDGVPGAPYDALPIWTPVIGPQGDVAYGAEKEGNVVLVANGAETAPYPALAPGTRVVFHGPRSFHAMMKDGKRFFRVDVDIHDE